MFANEFPALNGGVVTQGHADRCSSHGHAVHTVAGVDTGICPRCGVVTAPAEDVDPADTRAAEVAVIRAEDVTPGTRVTGYSGSDPVTGIAAVAPGDIPGYTLITWSTEGGDTFTANVRNGDPVYTVSEVVPVDTLDPSTWTD